MSNPARLSEGCFAFIPRTYFFSLLFNQTPFDEIPAGARSDIIVGLL